MDIQEVFLTEVCLQNITHSGTFSTKLAVKQPIAKPDWKIYLQSQL
jgi:hypothetical protein